MIVEIANENSMHIRDTPTNSHCLLQNTNGIHVPQRTLPRAWQAAMAATVYTHHRVLLLLPWVPNLDASGILLSRASSFILVVAFVMPA